MKVYVVCGRDADDNWDLEDIFATREDARSFLKKRKAEITEQEQLDEYQWIEVDDDYIEYMSRYLEGGSLWIEEHEVKGEGINDIHGNRT